MPAKPPPKSHWVGLAHDADGHQITVYAANEALICGQCGAIISPGHLFSRHNLRGHLAAVTQIRRFPVCTACRPLQVEEQL